MPSSDERPELYDERVSTEPQRKALDAMSEDLVRKLHAMVAEQEARARDFAAHQHSLSSLPRLQQLMPPQEARQVSEPHEHPQHHPTITNGPQPATKPKKKASAPPHHARPHSPWDYEDTGQPAPEQKKEGGVSAGTIVFIIFIIIIILRNCS